MEDILCVRTFGECIRPYMKKKSNLKQNIGRESIDDAMINGSGIHAFYSMLFDSLISSIEDDDYVDIPDINNSFTSRVRSGNIDIPRKIVEIAQSNTISTEVEQFFSKYLIPNVPQESISTVTDAVLALIDGDTSIGATKQKTLKDSVSTPARFYAEVFVFAIQRNKNKIANAKKDDIIGISYSDVHVLEDESAHSLEVQSQYSAHSHVDYESVFTRFESENPFFAYYYSRKEHLYYPEHTLEDCLIKLLSNTAIIIKGRQGSGKTTLTLNMAERFLLIDKSYKIMYTKISADWFHIFTQIQYLKKLHPKDHYVWVIDDIHKLAAFENEIVNWPFSGSDKYIFITRNIDKTKENPYKAERSKWDDECIIKLEIDNLTFAKYIYADPRYASLTYRDVEKIFSMCGGDLSLLENYKMLYGTSISAHAEDEEALLRDAFSFFFPNSRFTIQINDFMDALKMLVMGMLDFPIPPTFQNRTCNTILAQFCYTNVKGELEFEHATIAELLFSCITNYLQMDFVITYEGMIRQISRELAFPSLRKDAITFRVNTFLQAMLSYRFVLPINRSKKVSLCSTGDSEETASIIQEHTEYISPSTWKLLLSDKVHREQNVSLLIDSVRRNCFIDAVLSNRDYNFRFIYRALPENEINAVNDGIIRNIRLVASQMDNSSSFVLLLRSLKDETAITFLEMLDQNTIMKAISNNDDGYFGFSCGLKYLHPSVNNRLVERIGEANLEQMVSVASMSATIQFIEFFGTHRQKLLSYVTKHKTTILANQMTYGYSVRRVCEIENIIRKLDPKLLESIECSFGDEFYLALLEGMGNIQDLFDLLASSSSWLRTRILDYLNEDSDHTKTLLDKVIASTRSIGTLNLSLKTLRKESLQDYEQIDQILGAEAFVKLISYKGNVMDLLRIVQITTPSTTANILSAFATDEVIFSQVIKRTIEKRTSIGTLGLVLHGFDKLLLEKIEELFTSEKYMELCRSNGNLAVLIGIMQHSTPKMQNELAMLLKINQRYKDELLNNTMEDEKSIGTFALCLKSLKEGNIDSLLQLEDAMGPENYLKLLHNRGNIVILSRFLQYMSSNMRKSFVAHMKNNPMTCDVIFENTFVDSTSVGTFHFSLREMAKEDAELLRDFEIILGPSRYLRIISELGNITVLFQILQYSTDDFKEEIVKEFEKNRTAFKQMIDRTIVSKASIRSIPLPLREIKKKNPDIIELVDRIIGCEGWIALFTQMGDIMTLLGCLAEMSTNMRLHILHYLMEHRNVFEKIVSNTISNNISLGTLSLRIKSINACDPSFIKMVEEVFSPDCLLLLMEKQAKLSTFLLTLGELSVDYLLSLQQYNLEPVIDAMFEKSLCEKDILFNTHYGIRRIAKKNAALLSSFESYLGKNRYKQLFIQGSSLFNVLKIAAYSTIGIDICADIVEDESYYQALINIDCSTELLAGFEVEMYAAVMRRNSNFEIIVNKLISDVQWISCFKEKCDLRTALCIIRWLQGSKIKSISNAITSDNDLKVFFSGKWVGEITIELLNEKAVMDALEAINVNGIALKLMMNQLIAKMSEGEIDYSSAK